MGEKIFKIVMLMRVNVCICEMDNIQNGEQLLLTLTSVIVTLYPLLILKAFRLFLISLNITLVIASCKQSIPLMFDLLSILELLSELSEIEMLSNILQDPLLFFL